MHKSKTKQRIS